MERMRESVGEWEIEGKRETASWLKYMDTKLFLLIIRNTSYNEEKSSFFVNKKCIQILYKINKWK